MSAKCLLSLLLFLCLTMAVWPQGLLTPPGVPAPTMKTLDQVEPRTPISALPFTISAPGSYYLTSNLAGASGQDGITISANNVVLDLNGFTLDGGGPSSLSGIQIGPTVSHGVTVRNGIVTRWGDAGIDATGAVNCTYENINAIANIADGLRLGDNATAKMCRAKDNSGVGIYGPKELPAGIS